MAHPHQPPDSGAQGPGARSKALSCRHPHLDWFSVGVRRLEEADTTGLACRDTCSRLLTRWSLRSPGGPGGSLSMSLVSCVMVESRCSVLFVGIVVGGRGAPGCGKAVGRLSRFDPCTPGWFAVGRLACGLFTVRLRLQLRCGWCAIVLSASSSAWLVCVPSRCCRWLYSRILFA